MTERDPELASQLQIDVPHAARMWNYWMGGKDNFQADRDTADAVARVYPGIAVMARQSRRFLIRAVRFLAAEAGVRQFIDVGTGLPTMQNTHEVAQAAAPESRVVYVDNDPLVLVHARALLTSSESRGEITYVDADYHDPERILAEARVALNFQEPIAVLFMGVLGYEPDFTVARAIVHRMMSSVASGSYLVLWDGTNTSPEVVQGAKALADSGGVPYLLRSPDLLTECFEGLALVEPGLVPLPQWRPDDSDTERVDAYGAVARKP